MEFSFTDKPRDMAHKISLLKTKEERRAALEQVPEEWRELVKTHVQNTLTLAWHWRDRIKANPKENVPPGIRKMLDVLGL